MSTLGPASGPGTLPGGSCMVTTLTCQGLKERHSPAPRNTQAPVGTPLPFLVPHSTAGIRLSSLLTLSKGSQERTGR